MKSNLRSIRRHHTARLVKRWYSRLDFIRELFTEGDYHTACASRACTPKQYSSCLCCMNPRKNSELTLDEQRSNIDFVEQLADYKVNKNTDIEDR